MSHSSRRTVGAVAAAVVAVGVAFAGVATVHAEDGAAAPVELTDRCGFAAGSQWRPLQLGTGDHDLAGRAPDDDVSGVRVAAGFRVSVFDQTDTAVPLVVLTGDEDFCGSPLNDRASRVLVERVGAPADGATGVTVDGHHCGDRRRGYARRAYPRDGIQGRRWERSSSAVVVSSAHNAACNC